MREALAEIRVSLDRIHQARDNPTELKTTIEDAMRKVETAQAQCIESEKEPPKDQQPKEQPKEPAKTKQ